MKFLYLVLALTSTIFNSAQVLAQFNYSGKVTDANNTQNLPFVSLHVKGQSSTFIADKDGRFSFRSKNDSAELTLSSLGYKQLTVTVSSGDGLNIMLEREVLNMKDVVLVQRGAVTKFQTLAKIDLDLNPVKNTQELLRLMPGLFIAQHAGGGKAEQIFLRGFDVDHGTDVEVSVDGMPVNMVSHAHGQGYADAHFIIPETIDQLDFGAGPYYAAHGNLNTAGYVSYGTFEKLPASRVHVEAGRFNTIRTLAMIDLLKKNKDKQNAYLAGEYYYTNGPTINHQHFNRMNLFGKYNLSISPRTELTASGSYFSSSWDASGQIPGRAVEQGIIDRFGSIDPTEGGITARMNANLVVAHDFENGLTWRNQAFYIQNKFSLFSNFSFFANDTINGDAINQAEYRNIVGFQSTLRKEYEWNNWAAITTLGTGLRSDATQDSKLTRVVKRSFRQNVKLGDIDELNFSTYLQQQLSHGRWFVEAGLRFDRFQFSYFDKLQSTQQPARAKSILSPKINIQYALNPTVQLYVKSGKGFHSNDTRVVVANQGEAILPAALGGDIGVVLKPGKRLFVNVAAWHLHLQQEFVYVGDEGIVEPSGQTSRNGIDLVVRYRFAPFLFGSLNLNATRARAVHSPKGQDYIPLAPSLTSTGGLFYKGANGFGVGLNCRYIMSRPANEDNSITAKGYFITDASVNFTKQHFEIGLAVENLFNAQWNEAQFATLSRLRNESVPVEELNYTPGTPLFARVKLAYIF
ncbi:MAG: TonB-dependent receptor [Ferruginibacter sp.]|nr:TonB-dependent receptor [Ferruginibacter sp.]